MADLRADLGERRGPFGLSSGIGGDRGLRLGGLGLEGGKRGEGLLVDLDDFGQLLLDGGGVADLAIEGARRQPVMRQ